MRQDGKSELDNEGIKEKTLGNEVSWVIVVQGYVEMVQNIA